MVSAGQLSVEVLAHPAGPHACHSPHGVPCSFLVTPLLICFPDRAGVGDVQGVHPHSLPELRGFGLEGREGSEPLATLSHRVS